MVRAFVSALLVMVLCAGGLLAEEIKGKVKSVDTGKMQVTVTDDQGQDRMITVAKDTKITGPNGKAQKQGIKSRQLKEGVPVTVTYETKDGQMTASKLAITGKAKD